MPERGNGQAEIPNMSLQQLRTATVALVNFLQELTLEDGVLSVSSEPDEHPDGASDDDEIGESSLVTQSARATELAAALAEYPKGVWLPSAGAAPRWQPLQDTSTSSRGADCFKEHNDWTSFWHQEGKAIVGRDDSNPPFRI